MEDNEDKAKPPDWDDWKWQLKNSIKNVNDLKKYINLNETDQMLLEKSLRNFRMAITPYYASLMDPNDPSCPVRKQAVPDWRELLVSSDEAEDPLNEEDQSPIKGLVHRYPNRVLLLTTYRCAMYCRHCTRRRVVGSDDIELTLKELDDCIGYIRGNPQINDVLISGGDPLMLSCTKLEYILQALRAIEHVDIIRIGTRIPVVLPMRITKPLADMIRKYHPVYINTHFNHPKELTAQSVNALSILADAGIPLGNQTVLLKGINNDPDVLRVLFTSLLKARVKPYYLYQCDLAKGISHFRTTVDEGLEIMRGLQGTISGMAIPKYVIDAPGGGGKIPILPEYYHIEGEQVILENYLHKTYTYPNRVTG